MADKTYMFRALTAGDIDVRVAQAKENGVSLLLYKNARVDMNILDDTVGPFNWRREHVRDNANCIVSIYDREKQQWIYKEDTGTESNTEAEKGLASDSFKRACFNWGIGRELYTAPFIWIKPPGCKLKQLNNGKYKCDDKFVVTEIEYNENREIVALRIARDDFGELTEVFTYPQNKTRKTARKTPQNARPEDFVQCVTPEQIDDVRKALAFMGCTEKDVLLKYGIPEINSLSIKNYNAFMESFKKWRKEHE